MAGATPGRADGNLATRPTVKSALPGPPPRSDEWEETPTPDELVDFGAGFGGEADAGPPARFGPGDPVPIFRTDLQISRGRGGGTFEVTDPTSGRHFTLYEFELSIARMLDGRRSASDVVENGVRLGIPVELDGLYKFVRQLWHYGFLAPPGTPPPAEGSAEGDRPDREKWDEATRALFQSGLRLVRQGRPKDAASYFQAVLDADPGNAEASERLAAIERGETVAATPIGQRTAGGRAGGRPGRRTILLAIGGLLLAVGAVGVALWRRSAPSEPARPAPPSLATPVPSSPPPPVWRTAAVQERTHPPLARVDAPSDGVVIWKKSDGRPVMAGERIGTLRAEAVARGPGPIDPAAAARIRELEALAKKDPVYRDFLEKERRAALRRRRGGAVRELPLVAPAAGVLVLDAESRARVERGAVLATVVDDRAWVIEAFLDGEPPAAEAECELRGDAVAERASCRLDGARPQDGGSQLTIKAQSAEAPWAGTARSLRVRIAPLGTPPDAGRDNPKREAP